jgi:membrane protease YdiL (CAAX protease family)
VVIQSPYLNVNKATETSQNEGGTMLVAPLWHTGLLVLLIFVWTGVSEIGSKVGGVPRAGTLAQNRDLLYLLALGIEWGAFGFVYAGLHLRGTTLATLIGKRWQDSSEMIRDVVLGIGAALSIFCLTALLIFLFGPFDRVAVDIYPKTAVQFYFFLLMLVSGGFTEEVIFRGYFLKQLAYLFKNELLAISLQAVLFSLAHGLDESIAGMCTKLFTGFVFGYIASRRKSLLPAVVGHCGLNAAAAILSVIH